MVSLHVYLTAYSAIRYYNLAAGGLLVYDVTSRQSFDNLDRWLREFYKNCDRDNSPVIIVGNKADLGDRRRISLAEGRLFAGMHFYHGDSSTIFPMNDIFYDSGTTATILRDVCARWDEHPRFI